MNTFHQASSITPSGILQREEMHVDVVIGLGSTKNEMNHEGATGVLIWAVGASKFMSRSPLDAALQPGSVHMLCRIPLQTCKNQHTMVTDRKYEYFVD